MSKRSKYKLGLFEDRAPTPNRVKISRWETAIRNLNETQGLGMPQEEFVKKMIESEAFAIMQEAIGKAHLECHLRAQRLHLQTSARMRDIVAVQGEDTPFAVKGDVVRLDGGLSRLDARQPTRWARLKNGRIFYRVISRYRPAGKEREVIFAGTGHYVKRNPDGSRRPKGFRRPEIHFAEFRVNPPPTRIFVPKRQKRRKRIWTGGAHIKGCPCRECMGTTKGGIQRRPNSDNPHNLVYVAD